MKTKTVNGKTLHYLPVLSNGRYEKYDSEKDKTIEVFLSDEQKTQIFDSFEAGKPYLTIDHKDHREGDTSAVGYMDEIEKEEEGNIGGWFDLNKQGIEIMDNRLYKRTSVLARPDIDGKLKLVSLSLTNAPADVDQVPIVFSKDLTKENKNDIIIMSIDIFKEEGNKNKPVEAENIESAKKEKEFTMLTEAEQNEMKAEIEEMKAELKRKEDELKDAMTGKEEVTAEFSKYKNASESDKQKAESESAIFSSIMQVMGLEAGATEEAIRKSFADMQQKAVSFDNTLKSDKKDYLKTEETW